MKGVSLDLWELIATAQDTYRGTLYLCLAGISRLGEESRLKRIRVSLTREKKSQWGTCWVLDTKWHREDDLPAVTLPDGTLYWYKNDKLHQDGDLPAVIQPNGTQAWWKNGKRHREEGPAIIDLNGTQDWFKNGKPYNPNKKRK